MTAPPQLSPDGRWWWDGTQWVPAPQQPAVQQYQYGYAAPAPQPTDGKAVASLILGIVWGCGLGSIAAVVLGHMSRSESRRQQRPPSGMALAGLILGYLGIAGTALMGLVIALSADTISEVGVQSREVTAELRLAGAAEEVYRATNGSYSTDVTALQSTGYVPSGDVVLRVVSASETSYCLTAHPIGGIEVEWYLRNDDEPTVEPCT